jgi:hypothetical protein
VIGNFQVIGATLNNLQGLSPCPTPTDTSSHPGASATPAAGQDPDTAVWVWRALKPFDGIGINVTTKRAYLTAEIASSYSGGGMDPNATFQEYLMINTDFPSQDAAMATLCAGLTDVRMWPLGTGMRGVWQGTVYPLGDSVECPSQ